MTDEQQLRERAEAILNSHEIIFNGSIQKMKVTQAMIDFHKQELSGIGEVVYVPIAVGIETFPKETGYYFTIQQEDAHGAASIFVSHFDGSGFEMPRYCAQPTHWLKKLTLSGEESSMEQRP